jgi:hypothetical protein
LGIAMLAGRRCFVMKLTIVQLVKALVLGDGEEVIQSGGAAR